MTITNEDEHAAAMRELDALIRNGEPDEGTPEAARVAELCDALYAYEQASPLHRIEEP